MEVEGKTKKIKNIKIDVVSVTNKSVITAGNGKVKMSLKGKDIWATTTTANILLLLEKCGIETHFLKQDSPNSFLAISCDMLKMEVVVRRTVPEGSSYTKRHPDVLPGTVFENLPVEFFWKDDELDDPIIVQGQYEWHIYDAGKPISEESFLKDIPFLCSPREADQIRETARSVFSVLEQAFDLLDLTLEDLKIEFGRSFGEGKIILADVIDLDSLRALDKDGGELSKQGFRNGDPEEIVRATYKAAAELSEQLPGLADQIKLD